MSGYCTLYVTASSTEEAETIASALLEEQLIACANIIPGIISLYRWQGTVEHDSEVAILLKTRTALAEQVTERVKSLHSYDCPCIVEWPIAGGNGDYLNWIGEETARTS